MITCPSCNHQNPEGSLQCENCYTPLPASTSCPNCGASVQTDATFCGQCGFNLQAENPPAAASIEETAIGSMPNVSLEEVSGPQATSIAQPEANILPETSMSSPINSPWDDEEEDLTIGQPRAMSNIEPTEMMNPIPETNLDSPMENEVSNFVEEANRPWSAESPDLDLELDNTQANSQEPESTNVNLAPEPEPVVNPAPEPPQVFTPNPNSGTRGNVGATQLQLQTASLLHLQSNTNIDLPDNVDVVHIGKPNGQIPPDIDVAGFPDSEVVSRVHADIRIEGDTYYMEDTGSSNGTYVNHAPLVKGNRHRLRPGDRIALGKGDLVTFIFQLE